MRYTLSIFIFGLLLLPTVTTAQEFLVRVPGLNGDSVNFNEFINTLYLICISIAALIAVVKIIIAGVKYMFTDIVSSKGDAKKDIQGALLGLAIILCTVLILSIINPRLTGFELNVRELTLRPPKKTEIIKEQVFTSISNHASIEEKASHAINCEKENGLLQINFLFTNQQRCFERNERELKKIREDLTTDTIRPDRLEHLLNQYTVNVTPNEVTDYNSISEIIEYLGDSFGDSFTEEDLIFSVRIPMRMKEYPKFRTAIKNICQGYQDANPNDIISLVYDGEEKTFATCVRVE